VIPPSLLPVPAVEEDEDDEDEDESMPVSCVDPISRGGQACWNMVDMISYGRVTVKAAIALSRRWNWTLCAVSRSISTSTRRTWLWMKTISSVGDLKGISRCLSGERPQRSQRLIKGRVEAQSASGGCERERNLTE
jgi:hypothetical protein